MVDVGAKEVTRRIAVARGFIKMSGRTARLLRENQLQKGDAVAVAELAGVMAAKKTHELIPLCHQLHLSHIAVEVRVVENGAEIEATVKSEGKTGVEMEALTACSVAALAVYDMCKAVEKDMEIGPIHLVRKEGGKSGSYIRR